MQSATQYDEKILQTYADRLYSKARWAVFSSGFAGFVFGAAIGFVPRFIWIWTDWAHPTPPETAILMFVLAVAGTLLGVAIGQALAFHYRFEAQKLLCQMQIERNTRPAPNRSAVAELSGVDSEGMSDGS